MKTMKSSLLSFGLACGLLAGFSATAKAQIVYREIFPNTTGSDQTFLTNANGWGLRTTAGAGVSSSAGDVRGINGNPIGLPNVNAGTVSSADQGFVRIFNGIASGVYAYTTEYGSISAANITNVSWYQGNQNTSDTLQVLLSIGGTTYISQTGFTNTTGLASSGDFPTSSAVELKTLTISGATWFTLTAEPNTIGTSTTINAVGATLPTSGLITGFGLYASSFANSASGPSGQVRFDNFAIQAIPEPTTLALLAGSLSALAIFRRRRQV